MSDDDNVTRLPIGFKQPPGEDGRTLRVVDSFNKDECNHQWRRAGGYTTVNATYLLRTGETEVECGFCGTRLDPMWVLQKLAYKETDYENKRRIAKEEMARLSERSKTQCDHCGKMTRISRAKAKSA